ncbi:MAG: hypothetical protein GX621_01285, partial [Pirellulaceae bacterium]|nr:hypothetical protein [Pirellulaceae bacterium]
MRTSPPSSSDLLARLHAVNSIEECFARGGFKYVYRAIVGGRAEALKVIALRTVTSDEGEPNHVEAEAFLREQYARIRREIDALGHCRVP